MSWYHLGSPDPVLLLENSSVQNWAGLITAGFYFPDPVLLLENSSVQNWAGVLPKAHR
jgi:hypothetical protein